MASTASPAGTPGGHSRLVCSRPGAAYSFAKGADAGDTPLGLLGVQRALVINTSNTVEDREVSVFGDPLARILRDCLLGYCWPLSPRRNMIQTGRIRDRRSVLYAYCL
jgi:NAD(P)H dehydrogenase (quinone)